MLKMIIEQAIALKEGNKDFALFYYNDEWQAAIGGNPDAMLGEIDGEFQSAWQLTPELAVLELIIMLKERRNGESLIPP